jgi:hypothetical protein
LLLSFVGASVEGVQEAALVVGRVGEKVPGVHSATSRVMRPRRYIDPRPTEENWTKPFA